MARGGAQIILETNKIGRQANGAIMATQGETVRPPPKPQWEKNEFQGRSTPRSQAAPSLPEGLCVAQPPEGDAFAARR